MGLWALSRSFKDEGAGRLGPPSPVAGEHNLQLVMELVDALLLWKLLLLTNRSRNAICLWLGQKGTTRFFPQVRPCRDGCIPLYTRPALTKPSFGLGLDQNGDLHDWDHLVKSPHHNCLSPPHARGMLWFHAGSLSFFGCVLWQVWGEQTLRIFAVTTSVLSQSQFCFLSVYCFLNSVSYNWLRSASIWC